MLFQVEGWKLKNDKNIALGGVQEKKKKNKNKDKKKERPVEQKPKHEAVEEGEKKPAKSKKNEEKGRDSNDSSEPKTTKDRKKRNRDENSHGDPESITDKRAKTIKKVASSTTTPKAPIGDSAPPVPVTSQTKLTPLQQKMMSKLSGSRFRWINEQLYTISSEEALRLIKEQPSLFDEYHQGFKSQVSSWPENPVDVFVKQFESRLTSRNINAPGGLPGTKDKKIVVADMGCGEAQFSADVTKFVQQQRKKSKKYKSLDVEIHSFDLKKQNDRITVADIANVPMENESATIVIFCLALMGTNFLDFIKEAYRILQPRGELWIAEIKSRFNEKANTKNGEFETMDEHSNANSNVGQEFVDALKLCGFFHKSTDNSNKMFTRFEFFKPPQDILDERRAKMERRRKFIEEESEKEKLESKREAKPEGQWLLKPCIYKRR
ncbi:RRP8 [Candida theae]|uniref:Ribosomal RNA-processing protein 8 n=1 Tax=Candida theae TaxID=1198502 RepID=A0AAD5BC63_9ASCO|nr:RRP8 [Candida theae]KAI5953727.1 RRP8 [Candida theae]